MSGAESLAMTPFRSGLTLTERWQSLRDRLLANASFQSWAVCFPLTRPIANRRAKALFDLSAGFVYSQVLAACVKLRLFEILSEGPKSLDHLAERLSLSRDAAARLLDAAMALRLVERRRNGRFGLGALGAATLGAPGVVAMIEHHAMLYADLRDPVALLRGEQPDTSIGALWPYAAGEHEPDGERGRSLKQDDIADYSTLMSTSQPQVSADILAAYRFDKHTCLLDLGGGDGTFLRTVAKAAPNLKLKLLDLPAVAERARGRFAAAGLGDRAEAYGGDFRTGPLPEGADIISRVRVIHDHDDNVALEILRTARKALPPGGTLLLAEPMAGTAGAETVGAYFDFYLLAMGSGRPRTVEELTSMLQQAGFASVRLVPTRRTMLVRVLIATCS
jgi:demethylspheroidene O-methyltransferase